MADQLSTSFSVSAAELNRRFGDVRRHLDDGVVVVTHHGNPTMVMMSVDHYRQLTDVESPELALAWRRKLQIILDHIREGYVSVDRNFDIQTLNRVGELFVGRTRDELIGMPLAEAFPAINVEDEFHRVFESGEIRRFERNSAIHPDRRVAVTMIPLPLPTGGVGVLFDNITDQTRAQAVIAEQKTAMMAMLAAVDDRIIFSSDGSGRIDLWGAGARAILGWHAGELKNAPLAILFVDVPETSDVKEARLRHKDGSVVVASGTITRLSDATESSLFVFRPE